jgi:hypothetical protein
LGSIRRRSRNKASTAAAVSLLVPLAGWLGGSFTALEIGEFGAAQASSTGAGGSGSGQSSAGSDPSRTAMVGTQGHWKIENDQLVQTTMEADAWIVFGDRNWTDYTFAAGVKVDQSKGHVGLYFRNKGTQRGDNYFYAAGLPGQDAGSICCVAGSGSGP